MNHLFGPETKKALKNFNLPAPHTSLELIYAIVQIKKSAARTHLQIGSFNETIGNAIVAACDEILAKKHDEEFITSSIQGGAGTSINMNVNEVIASRASTIADIKIHPINHVNLHQSTNDVNPSALRLVCIHTLKGLINILQTLHKEFTALSRVHKTTPRLSHTHMQDAVPSTYGELFASYGAVIDRHRQRFIHVLPLLYELSLGGCAIGNGRGSSLEFINAIYPILSSQVHENLIKSENPMSLTNSVGDFSHVSSLVHILMLDLSKIASDFRFLSSGPMGGIGEMILTDLQVGSSIMPGKVNPVIPEMVNQIFYTISGNHTALIHAAEQSHLDLALMFPVIANSLIQSMSLSITGIDLFIQHCLHSLTIQVEVASEHLNKSTACAALFIEQLGYDTMANLVRKSVQTRTPLRDLLLKHHLITGLEYDRIVGIDSTDSEK